MVLPKLGTVSANGERQYSDQDKYIALAAVDLNGGNVYRTAIALGLPASTLRDWDNARKAKPEEFTAPVQEKRGDLAAKLEDKLHSVVESITPDVIEKATLSQRGVFIGIAADKIPTMRAKALHPDFESELCALIGVNRQQLPDHIDLNQLFAGSHPAQVIDVSPEPVQVGFTTDQQPLFLHGGQLFTKSPDGELIPFTPPAPAYSAIPDPLNPSGLGESEEPPPAIRQIAASAADDIISSAKRIAAETLQNLDNLASHQRQNHIAVSPNACSCGFSGSIHALTDHFASAKLSEGVRNLNLSRHSPNCSLRLNSSIACSCGLEDPPKLAEVAESPSQGSGAEATDDSVLLDNLAEDDLSN